MTTLGEFLENCDGASWMMALGMEESDLVVASGPSAKPFCDENSVYMQGITIPKALTVEIKEQGRKAGKLVDGTLIEDCAVFKKDNATFTIWRIRKD